jgi:Zn-dependent protease/CBS domain-containing protein
MKNSYRLARVMGIDIDVHITFFLLLALFFFLLGPKGLFLVVGVFFFVTVHEICHSLAAAHFGIKVKRITLLPIGGVAAMPEMPTKPYQELIISLAGPMSNVLVVVLFYYPLRALLGQETLMYPLFVMTGQAAYSGQFNILAHIYWINLILAAFNMIPAFPMDGGRVLRAALSYRMGRKEATKLAVRVGHIFALLFGYFGIVHGHIFLLLIAVFIYMSASGEGMQVMVQETIKRYRVGDVLSRDFVSITPETPLKKVLELIFHSHQEDFAVMEDGFLRGIVTRREVMRGMHSDGQDISVKTVMRTDVPALKVTATLDVAQKMMQKYNTHALPVTNKERVVGMVTMDDINRVFVMMNE